MLTERAIKNECFSSTLVRARALASSSWRVYDRRVHYGRYTTAEAYVEGSDADGYDAQVTFDEDAEAVVSYGCTCPAHTKYPGMCKHAAAIALLFINEPTSFEGFNGRRSLQTSPTLKQLLSKGAHGAAASLAGQDGTPVSRGTLRLELTLSQGYGGWSARFKVASPFASYVVKSIRELIRRIEGNEYFEYGKKLAFTHSAALFDRQSQRVIKLLRRLIDPSFAVNSYGYRLDLGPSAGRDLMLSQADVIDLLDLYDGTPFLYDDGRTLTAKPEAARVVIGNPPLQLGIIELEDGGWELVRDGRAGVIAFDERCYVVCDHTFYHCTQEFSTCADFLSSVYCGYDDHLVLAAKDAAAFSATLLGPLQEHLGLKAPATLVALKPLPCKLEFYFDKIDDLVKCDARALYGERSVNLIDAVQEPGQPLRDMVVEQEARDVLRRYLPDTTPTGHASTESEDSTADLIFSGIAELRALGDVFTTPSFDRLASTAHPRVSAGVSLEGNLINMKTKATDLEPAELALLLASYRKKKSYHRLSDGSYLSLMGSAAADMGLTSLDGIFASLDLTDRQIALGVAEGVTLPLHQAFLLADQDDTLQKDAAFTRFVEDFRSTKPAKRHTVPKQLASVLRPYQKDGYAWLNLLADTKLAGILADEMGLGKSLQVITWLLHNRASLADTPALIVCPASLVYNWKAEFAKFAPDMRVRTVSGTAAERKIARGDASCEVLVTSYDSLRMDIAAYEERSFFACIIDEAQYIKNHTTKMARAVKLIDAEHRLALTGTPIENRLSELWSIFDFLMPGMLGSYNRFKERYELPIVGGDEAAADRLGSLVGPFILRRLKMDVLKDLPDKLEQAITCQMAPEQRKLYDAHEQRLRMQIDGETPEELKSGKIAVLAELTKLRQICCDPHLLFEDYTERAAKLDVICDLVASAWDSGQKTLVFSQFTSFLALIANELDERGIAYYEITGATPKPLRLEFVDAFNRDETPAFLISLKAGGTGLNLVGASVVVHADPWWNRAAQNQASDRAHRIGQTRDVTVYQVIAENTIEERILKLQQAKADLADAVLNAQGESLGQLSREDLITLLQEG